MVQETDKNIFLVQRNYNMPKISIIIPMYNVEKYLRRCLDSVLNQTFTDWTAICVDDGSPDKSGEIAEEYAARDKRFIVIHKENGGLSDARNAGMPYARGEYIMYLDSDDFIHPQTMEIAYNAIKKNKSDIVSFQYDRIYRPRLMVRHILHMNTDKAEGPKSKMARMTMMVLAVTLHNIPEGMAVGVVFAAFKSGNSGISAGAAMALSLGIAIQNFPEGAIISMPLYAEGKSRPRSFWRQQRLLS